MRNRIVLASASLLLLAAGPNAAMTWQRATVTSNTDQLFAVVWGNGQYVAVGAASVDVALTSPDGITWSEHSIGLGPNVGLYDIVWNGTQFLSVGESDVNQALFLTSADGRNWTAHPQSGQRIRTVAWNGNSVPNHYLALGPGASPTMCARRWYSTDGSTWTSNLLAIPNCTLRQIIWTNQFIAVGEPGLIMTSPDGATWTEQASGTTQSLWDIVYASGLYVAVGHNATDTTVLTSPDSVIWTPRTSGISSCPLEGVAHNGTIFVAVGGSCMLTSPDGINWHRQGELPLNPGEILLDVTWSGFRWVAVGWPDLILYSDDTTPVELQSFTVE